MASRIADAIKYISIYIVCFFLTIACKYYFFRDLVPDFEFNEFNNIYTSLIFASFLFVFSFIFNNTSVVDMGWGSLGILLFCENVVNRRTFLTQYLQKEIIKINLQELAIYIFGFSLILIYSFRHILIYIRNFKGLDTVNEDFRYIEFKTKYGSNKITFWTFNYLLLHQIPLTCLTLAFQPVFTLNSSISNNQKYSNGKNLLWLCLISYSIGMFALIIETIADEQLAIFRKEKENLKRNQTLVGSRVIYFGLWRYLRHPNYFGEVLYFFSLTIFSYGQDIDQIFKNSIGFLSIFLIFMFYSVPAMENYLLRKYKEEYLRYQSKVKFSLIPLLY